DLRAVTRGVDQREEQARAGRRPQQDRVAFFRRDGVAFEVEIPGHGGVKLLAAYLHEPALAKRMLRAGAHSGADQSEAGDRSHFLHGPPPAGPWRNTGGGALPTSAKSRRRLPSTPRHYSRDPVVEARDSGPGAFG